MKKLFFIIAIIFLLACVAESNVNVRVTFDRDGDPIPDSIHIRTISQEGSVVRGQCWGCDTSSAAIGDTLPGGAYGYDLTYTKPIYLHTYWQWGDNGSVGHGQEPPILNMDTLVTIFDAIIDSLGNHDDWIATQTGIDSLQDSLNSQAGWVAHQSTVDSVLDSTSASYVRPTVPGRTLDIASTGEAGVDFSNINGTLDAAEINTDAIGSDQLAASAITELLDSLFETRVASDTATGSYYGDLLDFLDFIRDSLQYLVTATDVNVSSVDTDAIEPGDFATGAIDADALATDAIDSIVAGVWNELLNSYTTNQSAGKHLRTLASVAIITGTAVDSGNGLNQITLDGDASSDDGAYDPAVIVLVNGGTGGGQSRTILQYEGSTKLATVDRNWKTNPDNTSQYVIFAGTGREHVNEGLAQAGASMTITLNTLAAPDDNAYVGHVLFIRSGIGEDQARTVTAYNGTTKVATVGRDWDIIPDTTSAYVMLPTGLLNHALFASEIADSTTESVMFRDTLTQVVGAGKFGYEATTGTAVNITTADKEEIAGLARDSLENGTDALLRSLTNYWGTTPGDVSIYYPIGVGGDSAVVYDSLGNKRLKVIFHNDTDPNVLDSITIVRP